MNMMKQSCLQILSTVGLKRWREGFVGLYEDGIAGIVLVCCGRSLPEENMEME